MPEIFECSKCGKVISETLAHRTAREYGLAHCLACEAAREPQRITTQPPAQPAPAQRERSESIPAPGVQREAPTFDKRITVNLGGYESVALGVSGLGSFEECDDLLGAELAKLGVKHRGVKLT